MSSERKYRALPTRLMWSAYLACKAYGQARFPFEPLSTIRRAQAQRIQSAIRYAKRHVPYYREALKRLGLGPSDFQSADDLARLPIIGRAELQRDPEYFTSTARPLQNYLALRSSGSAGVPCTVYHDARAVFQNAAHSERERVLLAQIVGKRLGYRSAVIARPNGSIHKVQRFIQEQSLLPSRVRVQRLYLPLDAPMEENVRLLNEFKPGMIISYGSYLEMLFAHLEATSEALYPPELVLYSSDSLSEPARRRIEQRFGIPVFSVYTAIEAFKIGFECERHTGLHLNIDLYPLRIIDEQGRSLPEGEHGDVVISNLVNRATVLLNYRLGDRATLLPDGCRCGRSLPLLSFPQGRSNELITLASGRVINPHTVRAAISAEDAVWQYQLEQKSRNEFIISIVASKPADHQQMRQRIADRLADIFAEDVSITVAFVDSIERTEGGKIRPILALREDSL